MERLGARSRLLVQPLIVGVISNYLQLTLLLAGVELLRLVVVLISVVKLQLCIDKIFVDMPRSSSENRVARVAIGQMIGFKQCMNSARPQVSASTRQRVIYRTRRGQIRDYVQGKENQK